MTIPYEFMMAVHLLLHTNNYDAGKLKEAAAKGTRWIEQVRDEFDLVLRTRCVTVEWYDEHANDNLDDEETLYKYLHEVYDFIFRDGPWPET